MPTAPGEVDPEPYAPRAQAPSPQPVRFPSLAQCAPRLGHSWPSRCIGGLDGGIFILVVGARVSLPGAYQGGI